MGKINATISHSSISMNSIRLVSTDVPQTLAEGIAAALAAGDNTMPPTLNGAPTIDTSTTTNIARVRQQPASAASVIVSTASILVSPWKQVPTFVDLIDTTLTAVAVVDAGPDIVSNVTGITANQVTLTPASMTGIQVGMRLIHSVTDNYAGTFFVESVTATTYNIAAPFIAETTSTSDLVKAVDTGITVAAGEIYLLESGEDIRNFGYVSAATGVPGTLNIDLKWGG